MGTGLGWPPKWVVYPPRSDASSDYKVPADLKKMKMTTRHTCPKT
eukprot:SAG11_NODE_3_length_39220_cov_67.005828_12_plen_45_part_00